MYDYGARHYDAALGRWFTGDPLAEKYYSISPYVYVANNPVKYVDYRGDSISLATFQLFDKKNNSNFVQTIINDLQSQTGLILSTDSHGMLSFNKDNDGSPIVATKTDIGGSIIEVGSSTAKDLIIKAIEHTDIVSISFGARSGVLVGTNLIGLNPKQINKLINGSSNLDSRTLGWGMTLMHELYHTQLGGGLSDYPYSSGNPGQVVNKMNIIRSELNKKGHNYGQRIDYQSTSIGFGSIIPFSTPSSKSLKSTNIIPVGLPYILIK